MSLSLLKAARAAMACAVLAVMAAGTPVQAQQTKKASANNWIKQCLTTKKGKKICLTATNLFVTKPERARIAGVAIRTAEGEKGKAMLVVLPLGTYLTSGFTMQIDNQEARKGVFTNCRNDGCHAQFDLSEDDYQAMRKGEKMSLIYISARRKKINISIPLRGFSAAMDNPAVQGKK